MSRRPRKIKFVKTSAPLDFVNERNDCGVIAVSNVLCVPYAEAYRLLADAGRKKNSGTWPSEMRAAVRAAGCKIGDERLIRRVVEREVLVGRGVKMMLKSEKRVTTLHVLDYVPARGHFIVVTTTHAFAVVDGVVYDNGAVRDRSYLDAYYQVHF